MSIGGKVGQNQLRLYQLSVLSAHKNTHNIQMGMSLLFIRVQSQGIVSLKQIEEETI